MKCYIDKEMRKMSIRSWSTERIKHNYVEDEDFESAFIRFRNDAYGAKI